MQRGDLVPVSLQGCYGKPRPALVVQSNMLSDLDSIVLCPVTSELRNAMFRVTVEPNPENSLRTLSQVMVGKIRPCHVPKSASRSAASMTKR